MAHHGSPQCTRTSVLPVVASPLLACLWRFSHGFVIKSAFYSTSKLGLRNEEIITENGYLDLPRCGYISLSRPSTSNRSVCMLPNVGQCVRLLVVLVSLASLEGCQTNTQCVWRTRKVAETHFCSRANLHLHACFLRQNQLQVIWLLNQ